jgi:hypothetical protein
MTKKIKKILEQENKELIESNNTLKDRCFKLECEINELKRIIEDSQLPSHHNRKNERGAGRKKTVPIETKNEIYKLYEEAWTMDELAKKFGLSKGTIFNVMHEPE